MPFPQSFNISMSLKSSPNARFSFGEMSSFLQRIEMAFSFVALAGENLYQGMSENGRKSHKSGTDLVCKEFDIVEICRKIKYNERA